jgi:hypothetical protein
MKIIPASTYTDLLFLNLMIPVKIIENNQPYNVITSNGPAGFCNESIIALDFNFLFRGTSVRYLLLIAVRCIK